MHGIRYRYQHALNMGCMHAALAQFKLSMAGLARVTGLVWSIASLQTNQYIVVRLGYLN